MVVANRAEGTLTKWTWGEYGKEVALGFYVCMHMFLQWAGGCCWARGTKFLSHASPLLFHGP